MKGLKIISTLLLILVLLFGIVIVNFLINYAVNDNRFITSKLFSILYFVICFIAFRRIIHLNSQRKILYVLVLLFVFPTLYIDYITGGLGRKFEPIESSIGHFYAVSGFLWSIINIFDTSQSFITDNLKQIGGIKANNLIIIFQVYSILFALIVSLALLKLRNPFRNTLLPYLKHKYFILVCSLLSIIYSLFFLDEDKLISYFSNIDILFKTLLYLLLYVGLFIIYITLKKYRIIKENELIAIILILLFPTISVSSDYLNIISADTIPQYERSVKILPLVHALPVTVKYLFKDLFYHRGYIFSIKLYTLFQALVVLYVLPYILTPKINQNG